MSLPDTSVPGPRRTLRVCSAQLTSCWEDPEKTLEKAKTLIGRAAKSGAHIICFPEQFATGWDPVSRNHVQDLAGNIITDLQKYAKTNRIAVIGSFREASSPRPKNTAVAIGHDGKILATYAKMHLFSPAQEERSFSPGTGLGLFPLGPLTCGLAICYDLRFPFLFRIYRSKGAEVVFVPSAWPESRIKHWELFIRARAAENQMYIVGVNTTGISPVDRYSGASMTADPQGTIIHRANTAEQLLFSELDPSLVASTRASFPVERDHRDALYHSLLT